MQANFAVAVFAAMALFAVNCGLIWAGVRSELMSLLSASGLGLTTGLYLLGGAVMPGWERGLWSMSKFGFPTTVPPPARVEIGRLIFLGAGIWFTTGGMIFLAGAVLGIEDGLPKPLLGLALVAFAVGLVIFLVGVRGDRRRLDAARDVEQQGQRTGARP